MTQKPIHGLKKLMLVILKDTGAVSFAINDRGYVGMGRTTNGTYK